MKSDLCAGMTPLPDLDWSIGRFVSELASDRPVPGGGSAAALSGCLGCSLGGMVCRILLRRPKLRAQAKAKIRERLRKLDRLSSEMEKLIREDAAAYGRLVRAYRSRRGVALARAAAIRSPLKICRAAAESQAVLNGLRSSVGPWLVSDVDAGQALLRGAFEAAAATVEVNFTGMRASGTKNYRGEISRWRKAFRR